MTLELTPGTLLKVPTRPVQQGEFVNSNAQPVLRPTTIDDAPEVVSLFDQAIVWMNENGNTQQWGTQPWSEKPDTVKKITNWCAEGNGGLVAMTSSGAIGGYLVVGDAHPYVPAAKSPELYIVALIASRRPEARGFGRRLLQHADDLAREQGITELRVDCWAGAGGKLVRFYESAGYVKDSTFDVKGWPGQILTRSLHD